MNLGPKGSLLIKSFEKLRLAAYKPTPNDKWTIGYGHTGPEVVQGLTCTFTQACAWFVQDVAWAVAEVNKTVTVSLTQNQFDALVAFTFNVGGDSEEHSTLLKLLNHGDLNGVSVEWLKWNHQDGKVLDGLTNRRKAELALFQEPV